MDTLKYVRLPVKNAYNIRELGGYPCYNPSGITKWRAFLRADDLSALDANDIEFLMNYGIRSVIDLRGKEEIQAHPNPFAKIKEADYISIPLISGTLSDITRESSTNSTNFIYSFYMDIITNEKTAIKNIMCAIANCAPGCILFHCTAGKDRTGIIAALLLGLAGVNQADIISNYEATYTYIKQNPTMIKHSKKVPEEFLYSKAEYIESVLDYINEFYGDIYSYLISTGISEETLDIITQKIR